ncbi:MAG: antibiotic biosynthesis monooxygenase [Hyphomonadaceae bacterium]
MFAVVYRWRIKPGLEAKFEEGWAKGTMAIRRDLGGWGSRLHRTADGRYFAYAQWPDEASFMKNRAERMPYSDPEARKLYTEALEDSEAELLIMGEVQNDLLIKDRE